MIGLRVRSYHRIDELALDKISHSYNYSVVSNLGVVVFDRDNYSEYRIGYESRPLSDGIIKADDFFNNYTVVKHSLRIGSFAVGQFYSVTMPAEDSILILPDGLCAGLLLVVPILWLYRRTRIVHVRGVRCAHCGYDLRATPDRCPECGTAPPKMEIVSI